MKLQILIVAYGLADGILELHRHPKMDDVEYVVSWQKHDVSKLPNEILEREDIRIYPTDTTGISRNRNEAFLHADADYVMLSDADLIYTEQNIKNIIRGFEENPEMSILTFQYYSPDFSKEYPTHAFSLNSTHPKGYTLTSFEIGFNLKNIRQRFGSLADLRFNTNFGINGDIPEFICGEEDILVSRLLKKGYPGKFLPLEIATHPGSTTGMRAGQTPDFIATKGACIRFIHPETWFLRMLTHAWRSSRERQISRIGFIRYCALWLKGVRLARRNRVFDES